MRPRSARTSPHSASSTRRNGTGPNPALQAIAPAIASAASASPAGRTAPGRSGAASPQAASPARIDAGAHVLAEHGEVLAQIQARRERGHRALAGAGLGRRGRVEEPRGEPLLAGTRARGADELEQRAAAEQIEIERVGVRGIRKPIAGVPGAREPPVHAGERGLVERDGAPGTGARRQDAIVQDRERDERAEGREEPQGGEPVLRPGEPCDEGGGREQRQATPGDAGVGAVEPGGLRAA